MHFLSDKREEKIQQSRDDDSTIQHLQKLNDEISKLSVVPLSVFPSVNYSPRSTSDYDVDQLITVTQCFDFGRVFYSGSKVLFPPAPFY
jgi:hypothetical protein